MEIELEEEQKGGASGEGDEMKFVYDSTVDHKGRVPLRSSTGAWKASFFIIAIEFSERWSYFGIATNLISYLTKDLNQDLKVAVKNVNYWFGVTTIMPLIGGFVADAYLGRFRTALFSCIIYLLALTLLTMSQFIPSLKPCNSHRCINPTTAHEVVFFLGLYLISVGTGGHKPSLQSFGADQFDENNSKERKKKMSFFNWWQIGTSSGLLLGVTVLVYIQDFVSWGVAYIIISAVMGVSTVVFVIGTPFYRYRKAGGSPFTPMMQVLVAAMAKRSLPLPDSADKLYEVPKSQRGKARLLCHTKRLSFLDKAAIMEEEKEPRSESKEKWGPWTLATVTQVEEMKLLLNIVPIWFSALMFGICNSQSSTFFVKQGSLMNRKLSPTFTLPPASLYSLTAVSMIVTISLYDKILVPILRKLTGKERGITLLQQVGVGIGFSIPLMISAALVEHKRLRFVQQGRGHAMSVFWLAPQFAILGVGDAMAFVGLQEFFYDQVPDTMRGLGIAFYLSAIGVANFLSSFLLIMVDRVTEMGGRRRSWIAKDLDTSRLDKYYWLLAIMSAANLCGYMVLARWYSYKKVEKENSHANLSERKDEATRFTD